MELARGIKVVMHVCAYISHRVIQNAMANL